MHWREESKSIPATNCLWDLTDIMSNMEKGGRKFEKSLVQNNTVGNFGNYYDIRKLRKNISL